MQTKVFLLFIRACIKWVFPEILRLLFEKMKPGPVLPLSGTGSRRTWRTLWRKPVLDLSRQAQLQQYFQIGLRGLLGSRGPDATLRVVSSVPVLGAGGMSEDELTLATRANANYNKAPVLYEGRALPGQSSRALKMDVRSLITPADWYVQAFYRQLAVAREGLEYDKVAWNCQRAVCDFLRYVGDEVAVLREDFWQFPSETLQLGTGDCEDGAILLLSLLLSCGIPSHRVRVAAGYVEAGKNAELGGHAYVTYCRKSDNNWVVLDWCYYQDPLVPVPDKPLHRNVKLYRDIWFSFNDQYSWAGAPIIFASLKSGRKGTLHAGKTAPAG